MADPLETRDRILEATLELISEKGYLGATTREIAHQAGVSELTIFRKFGKKERLFEEVLKTYTFLPRLKDLIPAVENLPVQEALETIGIRFLRTLKERKCFVRIMLSEMNTYPEKVRKAYSQTIEEMVQTLRGYLIRLQAAGQLRDVPLDTAAVFFLRILFTTFMNAEILNQRDLSPAEMESTVSQLVGIFLHGVLAEETAG
ncbi:MAG: TetR/AcrR family transcriptional regulator [bacterium]|nr:MAG: TetR/AcrR family transcriptional regulator [bacterium]